MVRLFSADGSTMLVRDTRPLDPAQAGADVLRQSHAGGRRQGCKPKTPLFVFDGYLYSGALPVFSASGHLADAIRKHCNLFCDHGLDYGDELMLTQQQQQQQQLCLAYVPILPK